MQPQAVTPSFPLAMAEEGEKVRIVSVPCGRNIRARLLGMGIRVNDVVAVLRRQHCGAVLIAKGFSRCALGGGMAMKINVIKEK